jgi:hypothetical protein
MKSQFDTYTKGVLTVIAICLSIITIKGLGMFPTVNADNRSPMVGFPNTQYGLVPVNEDGSISVKIISADTLAVNLSKVSTDNKINVDLAMIRGYRFNPKGASGNDVCIPVVIRK